LINDAVVSRFQLAAENWVCDSYSMDIRYLAGVDGTGQYQLWSASVQLSPLPAPRDLSFKIDSGKFIAGQLQLSAQPKQGLLKIVDLATRGELKVYGKRLQIIADQRLDYYSEMGHRDRWYSDLHLQVMGRNLGSEPIDAVGIDNELRRASPPFDGLTDLASWLGLSNDTQGTAPQTIGLRVGPPVDLISEKCSLKDGVLLLTLHAHPKFDVNRVSLGVRAFPGNGLEARQQIANQIDWKRARNGRREGLAVVQIESADSVLTMLMIENSMVRRRWFADSSRARNNRLLAVQHFDKDLRMVKQAVLEPGSDSMRFEVGIAQLMFLLGFSPAVQLETDSPDLIITTPTGRIVVVECTTRIADFSSKLGKLVDRRGALDKSLKTSEHHEDITGVLVCALPRNQIAAQASELSKHKVVLVAKEELLHAFEKLRLPNDPDKLLTDAIAKINTA
jgi:hypothetical protein